MSAPLRDIIWIPTNRPSPRQIIAEVANRRGVEVESILGPSRIKQIVRARQEAMWEMRQRTRLSSPRIGQFFNRDHSTVLLSVKVHARRLAESLAR